MKISNYFIHKGEEDCISRGNGSGIIYFTGCNMHCYYCNIYRFSQDNKGYLITINQLIDLFFYFQERHCNNINLCNIIHHVDEIVYALGIAKQKGLRIPVIYNSNGYDDNYILHKIDGLVDIYLVDFKYSSNMLGKKYSGVDNYFDTVCAAIKQMYDKIGKIQMNRNVIKKGIIIRHFSWQPLNVVEANLKEVEILFQRLDK